MATAKTPAQDWIDAGLHALAGGGPDAVRVEALAAALGVTKGGFYWHFADRRELLDRMLDRWERTVVDEAIAAVDGEAGDARARLRRLFELAFESSASPAGLGAELAVRDWARRDPAVADRLRVVDDRRMAYLRALFRELVPAAEAEARALLVYSLFVGSSFIAAGHGRRSRRTVLRRALDLLVG